MIADPILILNQSKNTLSAPVGPRATGGQNPDDQLGIQNRFPMVDWDQRWYQPIPGGGASKPSKRHSRKMALQKKKHSL